MFWIILSHFGKWNCRQGEQLQLHWSIKTGIKQWVHVGSSDPTFSQSTNLAACYIPAGVLLRHSSLASFSGSFLNYRWSFCLSIICFCSYFTYRKRARGSRCITRCEQCPRCVVMLYQVTWQQLSSSESSRFHAIKVWHTSRKGRYSSCLSEENKASQWLN